MKKSYLLVILLGFVACFNFTSCSSDEDGESNDKQVIDIDAVFTGGKLKSVAGIQSIAYNTDGLVSSMTTEYGEVTFEYANISSNAVSTPTVIMTINEDGSPLILTMTLGTNGFVKSCLEVGNSGIDTWEFGYNSDGQLNYMKRSEGDNEVTNITYSNGNIIRTKMSANGEDESDYTINYTDSTTKTAIVNKGCLMLFDETLGIDMDEMKYAYYAGLLGKATKNLPIGAYNNAYKSEEAYRWTLNSNGLPTGMADGNGNTYSFVW